MAKVRERQVALLDDWLVRCQHRSVALLQLFVLRLKQDYTAVQAALERVGELKKASSRVTFVVAKLQGNDQTIY